MTRGQIAIVTASDELYTSIEFNGNMYMSGHGERVVELLSEVGTVEEYIEAVGTFKEENFSHYEETKLTFKIKNKYANKMRDMSKDYFEKWFSDYVYIKNISESNISFTDKSGNEVVLEPNQIGVFCFGRVETIIA